MHIHSLSAPNIHVCSKVLMSGLNSGGYEGLYLLDLIFGSGLQVNDVSQLYFEPFFRHKGFERKR
jgi:hypothetical protein